MNLPAAMPSQCVRPHAAKVSLLHCTEYNANRCFRRSSRHLRSRISPAALNSAYLTSPHPDAVRRRKEAEERQRKLRERTADKNGSGAKWWEVPGPSNLMACNTQADLQAHLDAAAANQHLLVLKFFAPHCSACKTMYPKLKQIAGQNPDVLFVKVNAGDDELRAVSEQLGVSKVPYFHFYLEGELVTQFTTSLTTIHRLRSEIKAHRP